MVQEVAQKWRERVHGPCAEPDAMCTDDVGRLKIVRISGEIAAVSYIAVVRSSPAHSGGSEVHIILQDKDAFSRRCRVSDYSELRQENALLAGRAPGRLIFHENSVDELNPGIVSEADPTKLAKHLRPTVRPRWQIDNPDPIETGEYRHLVQLPLKSARSWFAEILMSNSVPTVDLPF